MSRYSNKVPKNKYFPSEGKKPVFTPLAEKNDETILFCFERFDSQNKWSKNKNNFQKNDFWDIASKLKNFEKIKWQELAADEKKNHSVDFDKLEKKAQDAAIQIGIDDNDQIWSLRLSGQNRIWGVRYNDSRYFMVIWWDPEHQVCKPTKR